MQQPPELVRVVRRLRHPGDIGLAVGAAERARLLEPPHQQDQGRVQGYPLGGHEGDRRVVQVLAVLDGPHPRLGRVPGRRRALAVGGHRHPRVVRLLHDDAKLRQAVVLHVLRLVLVQPAAAGPYLDALSALLDHLPHGGADLVWPVGHDPPGMGRAHHLRGDPAGVAVATPPGQPTPARDDPRAADQPAGYRRPEAGAVHRDVPGAGDTVPQHLPRLGRGGDGLVSVVLQHPAVLVRIGRAAEVAVGVDDPRHEGGARRVENPGLPVAGDAGPGPDGDDRGILHHHDRAFQRVPSPPSMSVAPVMAKRPPMFVLSIRPIPRPARPPGPPLPGPGRAARGRRTRRRRWSRCG